MLSSSHVGGRQTQDLHRVTLLEPSTALMIFPLRAFPPGIVAADSASVPVSLMLSEAELEVAGSYGAVRRQEFIQGRLCAKACLLELGVEAVPIHKDRSGAPRWPEGVVGSISHTFGFCIAIAASKHKYRSVGVDVERIGAVDRELWPIVFSANEQSLLASSAPADQDILATKIFTAKEAFYKCQFPLTHAWVGFQDVEVHLSNLKIEVLPRSPRECSVFSKLTLECLTTQKLAIAIMTLAN